MWSLCQVFSVDYTTLTNSIITVWSKATSFYEKCNREKNIILRGRNWVLKRIRTWLDGLIIYPGKPEVKTALPLYEIMINMPDIAGDNPYKRLITAIEVLEDVDKEDIIDRS